MARGNVRTDCFPARGTHRSVPDARAAPDERHVHVYAGCLPFFSRVARLQYRLDRRDVLQGVLVEQLAPLDVVRFAAATEAQSLEAGTIAIGKNIPNRLTFYAGAYI